MKIRPEEYQWLSEQLESSHYPIAPPIQLEVNQQEPVLFASEPKVTVRHLDSDGIPFSFYHVGREDLDLEKVEITPAKARPFFLKKYGFKSDRQGYLVQHWFALRPTAKALDARLEDLISTGPLTVQFESNAANNDEFEVEIGFQILDVEIAPGTVEFGRVDLNREVFLPFEGAVPGCTGSRVPRLGQDTYPIETRGGKKGIAVALDDGIYAYYRVGADGRRVASTSVEYELVFRHRRQVRVTNRSKERVHLTLDETTRPEWAHVCPSALDLDPGEERLLEVVVDPSCVCKPGMVRARLRFLPYFYTDEGRSKLKGFRGSDRFSIAVSAEFEIAKLFAEPEGLAFTSEDAEGNRGAELLLRLRTLGAGRAKIAFRGPGVPRGARQEFDVEDKEEGARTIRQSLDIQRLLGHPEDMARYGVTVESNTVVNARLWSFPLRLRRTGLWLDRSLIKVSTGIESPVQVPFGAARADRRAPELRLVRNTCEQRLADFVLFLGPDDARQSRPRYESKLSDPELKELLEGSWHAQYISIAPPDLANRTGTSGTYELEFEETQTGDRASLSVEVHWTSLALSLRPERVEWRRSGVLVFRAVAENRLSHDCKLLDCEVLVPLMGVPGSSGIRTPTWKPLTLGRMASRSVTVLARVPHSMRRSPEPLLERLARSELVLRFRTNAEEQRYVETSFQLPSKR